MVSVIRQIPRNSPKSPASHIVRTAIPAGFTSQTKITAAFFSVNKTPPEKTLPQKQASPIRPAPDAASAILTTNLSTAIGDNRKHTSRTPDREARKTHETSRFLLKPSPF